MGSLLDFSQSPFSNQTIPGNLPSKTTQNTRHLSEREQIRRKEEEGRKFLQLRDKLVGVNQQADQTRFYDMNDHIQLHSDKDLPNFLHKLNLKLNLYQPDLKFTMMHKKSDFVDSIYLYYEYWR